MLSTAIKTEKLAEQEFMPKGSTTHYIVYSLEKYAVKNGYWYRVSHLIPSIKHFGWKCYRSEAMARSQYEKQVALEQWRTDKV